MQQPAVRPLRVAASIRTTLVGLVLLAIAVLWSRLGDFAAVNWLMEVSLALLGINLCAALASNRRFRESPALLAFHVCLALLVGLALWGRLTAFQGRIELADGQEFDPARVQVVHEGRWHDPDGLRQVDFTQRGFVVHYDAPHLRRSTASRVQIDGRIETVDDIRPLRLAGYNLYPTANKGFAILLSWTDVRGHTVRGAVNLPSYPLNEWNQRNEFRLPDGTMLRLILHPDARVPASGPWTFDSSRAAGEIEVEAGAARAHLAPGRSLALAGGSVRFDALTTWMGYAVYRDEALPWLFATALAGVVSLAWHVLTRLTPRPAGTLSTARARRAHA